jgi:hypothetical protein
MEQCSLELGEAKCLLAVAFFSLDANWGCACLILDRPTAAFSKALLFLNGRAATNEISILAAFAAAALAEACLEILGLEAMGRSKSLLQWDAYGGQWRIFS